MHFAGFVFFSTLEYIAMFFLMLTLFRFELKGNLIKLSMFSIVLSFVSNTLQIESLRSVSPLIQAALMILFVILTLRIHIFNAMIMVITVYVIIFINSWLVASASIHLGMVKDVEPYSTDAFILQSLSAFILIALGIFIYFNGGGFSFMDNNSRLTRIRILSKENRPLAVFLLFAIFSIFVVNLMFVVFKNLPNILTVILLFFSLLGLLYLSSKREGRQ